MAVIITRVCVFGTLTIISLKLLVSGMFLSGWARYAAHDGAKMPHNSHSITLSHDYDILTTRNLTSASVCNHAALLRDATTKLRNHSSQILFQHLHKAGGTTICHLATFNQHKIWSCKENKTLMSDAPYQGHHDIMDCNCNGPYGQANPFSSQGPQQQHEVLRNFSDATIFFNEGAMADEPLFDGSLVYITMVRHPVSRFLSHMLHALALQDEALYNISLQDPNQGILKALSDPNFEVKDNYMVRMYAGSSVDDLPRHQLRTEHLQRAAANLDQFAAVFLLEELQGPAQAALNGIMNFTADYKGYRSGTSWSKLRLERKIDPDVLQQLLHYMRYDMQLYVHAKTLHNLTVQSWQALVAAQQQHGLQHAGFGRKGGVGVDAGLGYMISQRQQQQQPVCPGLEQDDVSAASMKPLHVLPVSR